MKEAAIILPILALIGFLLFAAGKRAECPPGQIYIPRGFGGACVKGSWQ